MNQITAVDTLADVLKTVRLRGSAYFCADFSSPWGMDVPAGDQGVFHVVVEGGCWLKLENSMKLLRLEKGDIVAFPTGGGHWISDQEDSKRLKAPDVVDKILAGQNPFLSNDTDFPLAGTLLCGAFQYDSSINHPFLKDLPCFIHIEAKRTPQLKWLRSIIMVLSNESRNPSPGSTIMVDRLSEVLFIQLIRHHMTNSASEFGYMSALSDRYIGKALNLIHSEKQAYLSVEKLADEVNLSRNAFSEKFTRMVGIPPKSYLLDWRMQRARVMLEENELTTFEISDLSGYSSEAAFGKAFKQFFNVTPGHVRKR